MDAPADFACFWTEACCCAKDEAIAARMRSAGDGGSWIKKRASHRVTFFLSARKRRLVNGINLT